MSSTNRSNSRDSHVSDYYVTPKKPVEDFLRKFVSDEMIDIGKIDVLDPCAGGDDKNDMTYPHALFYHGADYNRVMTMDIREDSPAQCHGDFLEETSVTKFDLVITNPPFAIAQAIIEKSLEMTKRGGYVVMLLRLNYVGSKAREKFWTENPPYAVYAHNKRMSFTDDGKTDSIEYAHFVWKKGQTPEFAKFYIITEREHD